MEITKIEFYLENCEDIIINGKYIGHFNLSDVKYSMRRVAINAIKEQNICHHFAISLNRKGNVEEDTNTSFGVVEGDKRMPYERLAEGRDITSIYIYIKDQEQPKHFYPYWTGESDYHNDSQKAYFNKFGDLFLVIDAKSGIEDIFDMKEIENEREMNWVWHSIN